MKDIFNSEILIQRKTPVFISTFSFLIILIIIIFLALSISLSYTTYINTKLKVNTFNQVEILVASKEKENIISRNKIIIGNKEYQYQIIEIGELLLLNNENYQTIILKLQLESKYRIENLVLDGKIKIRKQKLINYLIDYLRKE